MKQIRRAVGWLIVLGLWPLAWGFAQTDTFLNYGDTVTGRISDEAPLQEWQFEGTAGDSITIMMNAITQGPGSLDSYLRLLNPDGQIITENDDANNTTVNALIEAFSLPADGLYTIHATRFGFENGLSSGEYELSLLLITETEANSSAPDLNPITYNSPVTGALNRQNYEDLWTFNGAEGDSITIRMTRQDPNSDLDSFLRLLDADGSELARNDDSPEGIQTSEIAEFSLPYSGEYIIVATRYGFESGTSSGDYVLEIITSAESSEPSNDPVSDQTEAIEINPMSAGGLYYGAFVDGVIEELPAPDNQALYEFGGLAGDVVTISVKRRSGDLEPFIALLPANANEFLAENDGFNGSADARIVDYTLLADGVYRVLVSSQNATAGEFTIHLFEANTFTELDLSVRPATSSPPPAPSLDLSNATLVIALDWEGPADFDLIVLDPDGGELNFRDLTNASGGIFSGDANSGCIPSAASNETAYWETEAPSGTYQIQVAHVFPCDGDGVVSYTLTISLDGEVLEVFEGELSQGTATTHEYSLD